MGSFWLLGAGAYALFIATTRALAQRITCDDHKTPLLERSSSGKFSELMFGCNIGGKVGVAEEQGKIDAIVTAYKERFKRQSVGVVRRPVLRVVLTAVSI